VLLAPSDNAAQKSDIEIVERLRRPTSEMSVVKLLTQQMMTRNATALLAAPSNKQNATRKRKYQSFIE